MNKTQADPAFVCFNKTLYGIRNNRAGRTLEIGKLYNVNIRSVESQTWGIQTMPLPPKSPRG